MIIPGHCPLPSMLSPCPLHPAQQERRSRGLAHRVVANAKQVGVDEFYSAGLLRSCHCNCLSARTLNIDRNALPRALRPVFHFLINFDSIIGQRRSRCMRVLSSKMFIADPCRRSRTRRVYIVIQFARIALDEVGISRVQEAEPPCALYSTVLMRL